MRPLLALALACLAACAAPSRAQKVQEAAYELNVGLRFGNTTIALEKVASDERKEFLKRHREWSGRVRVVDVELSGLNVHDSGEADVYVTVTWQGLESSDVHGTVIHQRWKDHKGAWLLVGEARAQGDKGLLGDDDRPAGEAPAVTARDEATRRYQTTIIR